MDYKERLREVKIRMDKVISHGERVFSKVDEEMYLISKSEKDQKKKNEAQKNLAIYIMAELLESFEETEAKEMLKVFNEVFK